MSKDKTAPELKIIGNVMPSGHNVGNIYDPDGISPTIMLNHGYPALILEETTDNDTQVHRVTHRHTQTHK